MCLRQNSVTIYSVNLSVIYAEGLNDIFNIFDLVCFSLKRNACQTQICVSYSSVLLFWLIIYHGHNVSCLVQMCRQQLLGWGEHLVICCSCVKFVFFHGENELIVNHFTWSCSTFVYFLSGQPDQQLSIIGPAPFYTFPKKDQKLILFLTFNHYKYHQQ